MRSAPTCALFASQQRMALPPATQQAAAVRAGPTHRTMEQCSRMRRVMYTPWRGLPSRLLSMRQVSSSCDVAPTATAGTASQHSPHQCEYFALCKTQLWLSHSSWSAREFKLSNRPCAGPPCLFIAPPHHATRRHPHTTQHLDDVGEVLPELGTATQLTKDSHQCQNHSHLSPGSRCSGAP